MQKLVVLLCLFVALATSFKKNSNKFKLKDVDSRIVNGERAQQGQFPWQVGLHIVGKKNGWFCGGSVISQDWILTAGHCVDGALSGRVIAGVVRLNDGQAVESEADDFILHEGYNPNTLSNDVGLIRLRQPFSLGGNVQSIRLADEPLGDGVEVTVSGWGVTVTNGTSVSEYLNFIQLYSISNRECEEYYCSLFEGIVCLSSERDQNQSTCSGDSGGPVVANAKTDPLHVAVISFVSDEGCDVGAPSGYARTAFQRNWIRQKTGI